jgi:pimeloyl-ACP methyl ester carboxylesterase
MKRVRRGEDGRYTWRGSPEAWKQAVRSHRGRDFWADWDRLRPPALLVRGGTSPELRERVARQMLVRNDGVEYEEFEGIGHNIPLLAPETLVKRLETLWAAADIA